MIQDFKIFAILLCLLARGDGDMPIKSFQIGAWTIGRNKGTILSLTLFPIRHRGHSKLCRIIVAKRPVTLKKQTKKWHTQSNTDRHCNCIGPVARFI